MDNTASVKKFIVLPQVQEQVPYSASHIWRLENLENFLTGFVLAATGSLGCSLKWTVGSRANLCHEMATAKTTPQTKTHGAMTVSFT